MSTPDFSPLFAAIDAKDADTFVTYFTNNGTFRFGNADPVVSTENIHAAVSGFFDSIKGLKHEVVDTKANDGVVCSHGYVTYTRHNDTTLRVPFCNVFNMDGDKIKDYLIFIDTSALYA
ncbi:MAG: nuclear transport factor 2 family protein [Bradyrhizobiaceae bacterium]|nr:nuclear transport factor 2 family protein [Bradyrhizobiaceae bacterium]